MPSTIGAPKVTKKTAGSKKKSWRKAVDISDITQGLDEVRAEERQVGSSLAAQSNDQLFVVDTAGDADVPRPKAPKKLLRSQQVLAERSAHPAVYSRPAVNSRPAHRRTLTHAEKDRLRRLAGREVQGPFNSVVETAGKWGEGAAVFAFPKGSHEYDAWKEELLARGEWDEPRVFTKAPADVKLPKSLVKGKTLAPAVPAVVLPASGQSYNPTAEAHAELIRLAVAEEERRLRDEGEGREIKERMMSARYDAREGEHFVNGMAVDMPAEAADDDDELDDGAEGSDAESLSWRESRKTAASKSKKEHAKKSKARQAEADRQARQKLAKQHAKDFGVLTQTRKTLDRNTSLRAKLLADKAARKERKVLAGLRGQKVGGHEVLRGGDMDVQLGDELSESWRQLEPEGNLFRDRYASLQHRALVEPRRNQSQRKIKRVHVKTYEKHPWKQFK